MYKPHPLCAVWKEDWQRGQISWATDGRWRDNCLSSDNLNLVSFLIKIKKTPKAWENMVKKAVINKTKRMKKMPMDKTQEWRENTGKIIISSVNMKKK